MSKFQNIVTVSINEVFNDIQQFAKDNPNNETVKYAIAQATKEVNNNKIQNNDRDRKNQLQR